MRDLSLQRILATLQDGDEAYNSLIVNFAQVMAAYAVAEGYIIDSGRLYISGTRTVDDWTSNLAMRPFTEIDGMLFHRGFAAAAARLNKKIEDEAPSRLEGIYGHSRGGAIGSILASLRGKNEFVITIGCPNFAKYSYPTRHLFSNISHFVASGDIVPTIPPDLKKIGFESVITCNLNAKMPYSHSVLHYLELLCKLQSQLK